jgi:hypothetical protein
VTNVLVLVEGQTEERFVKDVLEPHFSPLGVYLRPTLLVTKKVKDGKNFKGGVTNFAKFENDVNRLLASGHAIVTTLIDYYALPSDFPGMAARLPNTSGYARAIVVEDAINLHFSNPRFRAFLALHEFEALLFTSADELPRAVLEGRPESHDAFRIVSQNNAPEEINEHPDTAPSKRLASLYPSYRKTLHGPLVTERIGLRAIRERCPHFDAWMSFLEGHADL